MAKIYISSTFADLQEVRARAYAQLRKSRHDVISMEDYNASGRRPLEKCLADVRDADIYLGIFGWRYGFVPEEDNPDGHSITEREYREAVAAGKEIVTFLVDEAAWPLSLTDMYTGENGAGARIKALRAHISTVHVRGTFSTADELAAHLSPAIEEACARLAPASPAQLDNIATLTSEELQNLAARFGIENAFDKSDSELRRQLTLKAEDYRKLVKEVADLKGLSDRIDNIHAAAMEALTGDVPDLEEARALIESAKEIHQQSVMLPALEVNEKLILAQVDIALLEGDVDQAYRLLSAAADSFAAVDPLEPARRRILNYLVILRNHGLRFGGTGLALGRDLLSPILNQDLKKKDAWLWGAGENWRGIALQEQGMRIDGKEGAALLAEAVDAYRAALEVRTRADHPVDWAMTQNNLGIALSDQCARAGGPEGTGLLVEAVAAYRTALEVFTRADHPVHWATTQNNLGSALQDWARHTGGDSGAAMLDEAVAAYRAALEVRTRADYPVHWAATQNNLANALLTQGDRTVGAEGAALLDDAVTAFRAALEVRTRADHPVDWAMTQENIAIAELARARHQATDQPRPHLAAALAAVEGALEVFDPEHLSYNHEKATQLRDEIRAELDRLS